MLKIKFTLNEVKFQKCSPEITHFPTNAKHIMAMALGEKKLSSSNELLQSCVKKAKKANIIAAIKKKLDNVYFRPNLLLNKQNV